MGCALCEEAGGPLLWRGETCRIVRAPTEGYPGFLRVILNRHVREMTELEVGERNRLMNAVWAAESTVRELYMPDKVNLASFGNQVPHLHWHVIARYADDPHFPDPAWGAPRRQAPAARKVVDDSEVIARLAARLG